MYYSYPCTRVSNVHKIAEFDGISVLQASLHCNSESGYPLAAAENVIMLLYEDHAEIAKYPENFLPEKIINDNAIYKEWQELCKNAPSFDIYNPEEVAEMLRQAIALIGEQK